MAWLKWCFDVLNLAASVPLAQLFSHMRRNHWHARSRLTQQFHFAQGDAAPAHHYGGLALQLHVDWQVIHIKLGDVSAGADGGTHARMQTTLTRLRLLPPPAPGTPVLARLDGASAR